ncbi:MAG: hypothetical protein N7Q72_05010, partial [Spiroplasma sp. Tabriz.8]|nr:hypothetical protein [Spiroplasma sp. Tabriz.8]
ILSPRTFVFVLDSSFQRNLCRSEKQINKCWSKSDYYYYYYYYLFIFHTVVRQSTLYFFEVNDKFSKFNY